MSKITAFDKQNLHTVLAHIERLLATDPGLAEMGLSIKVGGGSYEAQTFKPKIQISCVSADGESADAVRLRKYAVTFGLPADVLGKTFSYSGRRFKVAGMKNTSSARCIICTRDDGKGFVFVPGDLARLLAFAPKAEGC